MQENISSENDLNSNQDNKDKSNDNKSQNEIPARLETDSVEASESGDFQSDIPEEILKEMPPEVRRIVSASISHTRMLGQTRNPFFEKLTEKNIDRLIDTFKDSNDKEFAIEKKTIHSTRLYVIITVAVFVFLILFLSKDNTELLYKILEVLGLIGAGFLGGYGYGRTKKSE